MIEVLNAGVHCSVQDEGRFGFAKQGIPQAGYLDFYAARMANQLLKNERSNAVLEITYGQGKFKFHIPTYICITGGDFSPKLNGQPLVTNKVHEVEAGAVLSFGSRVNGARTYVAVQGGIQSEVLFGSRSFFQGITKLRLTKGDQLKILTKKQFKKAGYSRVKRIQNYDDSPELDCFLGPEFDQLNSEQKKCLFEPFTISLDSNRVGYRLNEVIVNDVKPIITSAVLPGTVQLTPSGKLMILMRDCQVTGGYPRVLQLSETAQAKLSQKVTGEVLVFKPIHHEIA